MAVSPLADAPAELREDYAHLREPGRRAAVERARGCFVVEGRLSLEVLVASPYPVRSVLVEPAHVDAVAALLGDRDVPVLTAPREEVRRFAGFAFHRGVLAIGERLPWPTVAALAAGARRLLVVERVSDHENLGALFRNAAALGVDGVLLDPATTDPLYRRVVRVSVGNVLRVPIARSSRWPDDLDALREEGLALVALTPSPDAVELDELVAAAPARVALLVGSEGAGLSPAVLAGADHRARIVMRRGVDSLNVATAAAIALYALDRPGAGPVGR